MSGCQLRDIGAHWAVCFQVSIRAAEIEQSALRTFQNVLEQLQRRLVGCSVRVWRRRCDICGMADEAAVKMKLGESHDFP